MIEVYIDGASAGNPGLSGAGIFIKGAGRQQQHAIPLGMMNNQEAEFSALLTALHICIENQFKTVSFRTDSDIVAKAVENGYVRNEQFKPFLSEALELIKQFDLFFIKWIPGNQNKTADKLAREAIQKQ
ncbi:reverse transcriptase-like protein [Bacillaceae bacterium Marseille-Q3522]|nr:reverse transcriptase-like protein [Bacillaceae bacterium Marseille-Q3522]